MNYMEKMSDANSLIDAFKKAKRESIWKESVQRYEINLLRNTYYLQNAIQNKTYQQKPFYTFKLNERGHERFIKSMHISDRVVQRSTCDNILVPILKKYLIYDNGASLKGKGIGFTRKRLDIHLHEFFNLEHNNEGYVLLIDFRKFFDNIRHEELLNMMKDKIQDDEAFEFVQQLINAFKVDVSYMSDEEYENCLDIVFNSLEYTNIPPDQKTGEKFMGKSVGIGSQISQISGIFFPTPVDNYCKIVKSQKFYGRYMDDIYIIHKDKMFLKQLLEEIKNKSSEIGLFINEDKTQIVKLSHGFTFLKTRYNLTDTGKIIKRMDPKTLTRERRKLKKFVHLLEDGKMTMKDVEDQFKSWKGTSKGYKSYRSVNNLIDLYNKSFIRKDEENDRKRNH